MSKENNTKQAAVKNERTSVLEKIRRRTGLLVGIVGLALLIFILESLLGSGASIFGGDEMSVGVINGKKVDRLEFMNRLEGRLQNYRARNQGKEVDETVRGQAIDGIWNQYVVEYAIRPQFHKIGIQVGEDELYDRVVMNPVQSIIQNLTDQNGRVNEQFARPDGTLDLMKWRQAVQSVSGESEMAVKQMEDEVRNTRLFEKFRTIVNKGLYVTTADAEAMYEEQSRITTVSYVAKTFDAVSDSSYKVTDSDIEKYYSSHTYMYKIKEDTRKVEYVTFNVSPSPEDMKNLEADAQRVADELKGKTPAEDSSIISQESENGTISMKPMTRQNMTVRDSSIYTASPGTVYGPYNEGVYIKIYKLEAVNSVADSARVRHILIGLNDPQNNQPKRNKQAAKKEADSLLTLIKDKKVTFDTLVKTVSDDYGSRDKGGDYGWFDEEERFVEPFKKAGLMGAKGNISVVETEFGYHIIEVVDVSPTRHQSYLVAEVFKAIAPSDETNQRIFAKASQFAGENNTGELFDKAVEEQKLVKRLANDVKEGDRQVTGLDNAKEIVRWAFTAKKGDVSIFTYNDKHVVAKLASIKNKGVLPLEEVRDEIAAKALVKKKAEFIYNDFNEKSKGAKTVKEYASKLGLEIKTQPGLNMRSLAIDGVGPDNIFVGTACGTKQGETSPVITGENAVFVLTVDEHTFAGEKPELNGMKKQVEMELAGRTDYDVFNAIKENCDIEDHRSRID
jgi:peptidyl-prolyl cis-trans isomerase D